MQLVSIIIATLSLALLIFALRFVGLWHRAHRRTAIRHTLREGIGHIGISAIVEYPTTSAPLLALLEEHYPHTEAIVVIDLQRSYDAFGGLVEEFHLIKCNHTHLRNVRALYRSRLRTFRRVVIIDLPEVHRRQATKIAGEVASYSYALRLQGESLIARNALGYCANLIASYPLTKDICFKTIVGATARLERCDTAKSYSKPHLIGRIVAWRKASPLAAIVALGVPLLLALLARFSENKLLILSTFSATTTTLLLLYLSCRVVVEKGLFATFGTIMCNFCRYLVERVKNIHYLYKGSRRDAPPAKEVVSLSQQETNLK